MVIRSPRPMTYTGSARRVIHLRRRLQQSWKRAGITPFVIVLILFWWLAVTVWYPVFFGTQFLVWLIRRDARKHRQAPDEASRGPRA